MAADDVKLEPFRHVLARQVPTVPGEPIEMTPYSNDLPKSCGDPWRGGYSKHGIWYKIEKGTEEDFKKLVVMSYEQDGYLLCYDDFRLLEASCTRVILLVAKNIQCEVLGGILVSLYNGIAKIGCHFVQEDFRHSGIGSQLFILAKKSFPLAEFVFQSMHHLHPTVGKFGLQLQFGRKFVHYIAESPAGFPELKEAKEIKDVGQLNLKERGAMEEFVTKVTGIKKSVIADQYCKTAAFMKDGSCIGFGVRREVAGDEIRRILIGPLYTNESGTAEALLQYLLKEFYNPEEDFDFDPDKKAIYRRNVHFFIPEGNDRMTKLLKKFSGEGEKLKMQRLWYQTASSGLLPGVSIESVFAADNLHFSLI